MYVHNLHAPVQYIHALFLRTLHGPVYMAAKTDMYVCSMILGIYMYSVCIASIAEVFRWEEVGKCLAI